jgi:hypothetical protein
MAGSDASDGLPTGAYITIALLIGIAALSSWLIASYPGTPSERARSDDCEERLDLVQ